MSAWRRKAIEAVPQLKSIFEQATGPMEAWIEIRFYFERLDFDADHREVVRVLDYAKWCVSEASGKLPNDTSTAVCCAFYEHLSEQKESWVRFRSWFSPQEFESLKGVFAYHLTESDMEALNAEFYGKRRKAQ